MKTELKKLPKSQVEINFELDEQEFAKFVDKALLSFKEQVKIDGFRQGQVPLKMVEEKVGIENLLMEAGDLAVKDAYIKFIKENKIEPVSNPDVKITKIAKGSPMTFMVTVALMPEVELPDYKEIASKIKGNEISVDEKEIQEALEYLQKTRAKFSQVDRPAEIKDFVEIEYSNKDINGGQEIKDRFILGEAGFMADFENNLVGMKAGEQKEFKSKFPDNTPNNLGGKEGDFKVKMISVQKMELPEINDELAKTLGAFDSLTALKENIKEGIELEKVEAEKHRRRNEILAKIAEKVSFEIPESMIEYEQEKLMEDLKNQIMGQVKFSFQDYLSSIKKTEKEVKDTFYLQAQKRVKSFLVLDKIGKRENMEPTSQEIEDEANKFIKNHSKEQMEKIDIGQLREYSRGIVYNEKIFNFLENFSK